MPRLTPIVPAPGPLASAPKMSNKKLEEKYDAPTSLIPAQPQPQPHPQPPRPKCKPALNSIPTPNSTRPPLTSAPHQAPTPAPTPVPTLSLNLRRYNKILKDNQKKPENRHCFDCSGRGNQYVVLEFNTFVCTTCSGVHRELQHKIKSVGMSTFRCDPLCPRTPLHAPLSSHAPLSPHNVPHASLQRGGDQEGRRGWQQAGAGSLDGAVQPLRRAYPHRGRRREDPQVSQGQVRCQMVGGVVNPIWLAGAPSLHSPHPSTHSARPLTPPTTTPPRRYTNKRWYDESGVVAATPDVQPVSAVAARVACAVGPKGKACLLLRQRRRGWGPLRGAGPPPSSRLSGAATHLPRHTFPLNAL